MIIGIGTDLVRIERIEQAMARSGDCLAKRILRPEELAIYQDSRQPAHYLAKRFAAKEAASKALGTGIGKVSWQDFLISNDEHGAPVLTLSGAAYTLLEAQGGNGALLSLSDERDHALAFVVLSAS
ncbi:MAG: holo-ACP synthase [Porticoccaceae bacterium]|nr:holo-ACP synthase [Porticoccaceae bacterium]